MSDYDLFLKNLVSPTHSNFLRIVSGKRVIRELNIDVGRFIKRHVDGVFELDDGTIIHIEFQTDYKGHMPWRMLDYAIEIMRKHCGDPRDRLNFPTPLTQLVFYTGEDRRKLVDQASFNGTTITFLAMDLRDKVEFVQPLFESNFYRDWIFALLCIPQPYTAQDRALIARIITKVNKQDDEDDRRDAQAFLQVAIALRKLNDARSQEIQRMPFVINAASHSRILTGAIDHGRELGRREMMVDVLFDYMKPEKNEPQVALLETLESMSEPELLYLYTTQYKERINPNVMRDELNNVKGLTND